MNYSANRSARSFGFGFGCISRQLTTPCLFTHTQHTHTHSFTPQELRTEMYKRVFPTFPFRFCFSSPAATVLHTSHLPLFKQPPFKQPKQPKQQFQRLDPIFSRSYSKTRPSATMINASLPVATQASSEVLSRAASSHDSTFKILYFGLHGRGELSRNLLAYGDAKWEELAVVSDFPVPLFLVHSLSSTTLCPLMPHAGNMDQPF